MGRFTKWALGISILFLTSVHFFYYPKWMQSGTEATLSWDVSGYYWYLPAFFIYKDVKQLEFSQQIIDKYSPTHSFEQAFLYESGHYVFKYSSGQAVTMIPGFLVGHAIASVSSYPADGFSFPYQISIGLWSLLIGMIGIWILARILCLFFEDSAVSIVLLAYVFGTNYLEYTAITGSMTHNHLFTIYAIILWLTIRFYKSPDLKKALAMGILIGLAALTRPTEILTILIPVLWGITSFEGLKNRILLFLDKWHWILLTGMIIALIGSLQLIYWKYVSGHWLVYSYEDQGFSWLEPYISDSLFSYRAGWLVYTPIMIFALAGFAFLWQKAKQSFWLTLVYTLIFSYVAFSWDIWWYGGSLGQRTMIQIYPLLAFPMAALFERALDHKFFYYGILPLSLFFVYYNLWLTHQAHYGGLLRAGEMTRGYFRAIFSSMKLILIWIIIWITMTDSTVKEGM